MKHSKLPLLCGLPLWVAKILSPVHWAAFIVVAAAWLLAVPTLVLAQEAARPEVGKPLQAAQELLRINRFKDALVKIRESLADIQADMNAGRTPSEEKLLLLANCYLKQNNLTGYVATIEKLLNYYPKKTLSGGKDEAAANATPDGNGLVNRGFNYAVIGQFDKGISLMEKGLQKSGLKRAQDVKLHLGLAYLQSGKKDKAVSVLKEVQGSDGTAELARLWISLAKHISLNQERS